MSNNIDYRQILINFLCSISLADHLGDVADDAFKVIALIGVELPESVDEIGKFGAYFGKNHNGQTVWGTDVYSPEDYDDEYNYIG